MKRPALGIAIGCALALLIVLTVIRFSNLRQVTALTSSLLVAETANDQTRLLQLAANAKHHVLIDDASPFVGEVKNVDFLRTQYGFYGPAKNGDILIMTKTRAILYRPSQDIIVDMLSRDDAYRSKVAGAAPAQNSPSLPPPPALPVKSAATSSVWKLQPVQH